MAGPRGQEDETEADARGSGARVLLPHATRPDAESGPREIGGLVQLRLSCAIPNPIGAGNDYAACFGSYVFPNYTVVTTYNVTDSSFPPTSQYNGVSFMRSEVTVADVSDGTSNTYLIGEKIVEVDAYDAPVIDCGGDCDPAISGFDGQNYRGYYPGCDRPYDAPNARWPPISPGRICRATLADIFLAAPHGEIFNMAMCDGSVHPISYEINLTVHARLGESRRRPVGQYCFLGQTFVQFIVDNDLQGLAAVTTTGKGGVSDWQ